MMLAAAPQVLDNPCCDFIDKISWVIFLIIHIALFLVGAYLAYRSFSAGESRFGWGFMLFALAEISYMTYHINLTRFLFAHTVSEVLDGLAFILVFSAAVRRGLMGRSAATGTPAGVNR